MDISVKQLTIFETRRCSNNIDVHFLDKNCFWKIMTANICNMMIIWSFKV